MSSAAQQRSLRAPALLQLNYSSCSSCSPGVPAPVRLRELRLGEAALAAMASVRLICAALLPAAVAAQSGAGPGRCIRGCDGADEQAFVCPGQTDHCECPYDCGRDIDRDGVPDWCDCAVARACCLGAPPPPPPPPCGSGVLSSFVSQVETACCERDAADQCTKLNQLPDSCSATCAPVLADFLAECSSAMPDNFRNTLLPLAATCSTESGDVPGRRRLGPVPRHVGRRWIHAIGRVLPAERRQAKHHRPCEGHPRGGPRRGRPSSR